MCEKIIAMFKAMDTDENETIDWEEFMLIMLPEEQLNCWEQYREMKTALVVYEDGPRRL